MLMFFDTETTGLPDWRAPSSAPTQPHLVQLALVTMNDEGQEVNAVSVLVKPNGWTISAEVTAIHGISHERAMDEGIDEGLAVQMFLLGQGQARTRIAHNESFDRRIMRIAMLRLGLQRDFVEMIENRPSFCTMNTAKSIMAMAPTDRMLSAGIRGAKPPKLEECIRHFFGEGLEGAHDALVDARACARVYFALKQKGAA